MSSRKTRLRLPIGPALIILAMIKFVFYALIYQLLPRIPDFLVAYAGISLGFNHVGLSGSWLTLGRRRASWRVIAGAVLAVGWASILRPIGPGVTLPWFTILVVLLGAASLGGLVGRWLGLQLFELGADTAAPSTECERRQWQFSIGDLLLAMVVVAVLLAPTGGRLDLEWALGKARWLDVGCVGATAVLAWVVLRSTLRIQRDRSHWGALLAVGALGLWSGVLLRAFDKGNESWLAVHAGVALLILIAGTVRTRVRSRLFEARSDPRAPGSRRTNSRGEEWEDSLKHLMLLLFAVAWLLGPLRGGLDQELREFCEPPGLRGARLLPPGVLPLVVSAALTCAIAWLTLTVERGWRRWAPLLGVFALGVPATACVAGRSDLIWFFVPVFLLHTAWSLAAIALLRRAGYRLSRNPCSDTRLRNQ